MNERESAGCGGAGKTTCPETASDKELMERLEATLAEYKGKPGALIPVLQIAQGIFGYLPEVVLKRIALQLGKSYSEVAGVVGFYSYFSTIPRGRHLVRVCLGTACYVRGGKQVLESCRQELGIDVGGTTADGLFTLEVARCFGACGLAPTMMIDDDVHQRVKPQKLRAIFSGYRESISQKAKTATRATPKSKPRPRASLKANPKKKPVKMHVRGRKERVAAQ